MMSDDTEHTFMVAQALLEFATMTSPAFQRALARRLRWWLASLPAGVGFATLRAILKLWLGVPAATQRRLVRRQRPGDAQRVCSASISPTTPNARALFVHASDGDHASRSRAR